MLAVVHGLAAVGAATIGALRRRGWEVVAVDDQLDGRRSAAARELGVELLDAAEAGAVVVRSDLYSPSPGVPDRHPLFAAAAGAGVPIHGEMELAYRWEQERPGGPRPMLGITGTDGKTTTTLLTEAIVAAGGRRVVAAGNTDVPLIEAIDLDVDCFVVECTSFRLATTSDFRCHAAAWLNLAPDHLDWHRDLDSYEAAKARLFDQQRADDIAIGVVSDEVVRRHLGSAPGRRVEVAGAEAGYRVEQGHLIGPMGPIVAVAELPRAFPHDLTNSLVATALALESGLADLPAAVAALRDFRGPAHRIELVAEADGIRWYDDSKATTPHAAVTALRGFGSVVLIAGGRNKGLDLSPLAAEAERLRAVVAIGEAAAEIEAVFEGRVPLATADSMEAAVGAAAGFATTGDVVLLSPACASFDWYPEGGYAARGEHFRALVGDHIADRGRMGASSRGVGS